MKKRVIAVLLCLTMVFSPALTAFATEGGEDNATPTPTATVTPVPESSETPAPESSADPQDENDQPAKSSSKTDVEKDNHPTQEQNEESDGGINSHEHSLEYKDNGDGTHTGVCKTEDCSYAVTNEKHVYKDGICEKCGAKYARTALKAINPNAPGNNTFRWNYTVKSDNTICLNGYTGKPTSNTLELPSEIDGKPVTEIGTTAFYYLDKFTGDLVIPEGVTKIGDTAFCHCEGFTRLVLPSSLRVIGYNSFAFCRGLTGDLAIPEGVTTIEHGAFYGCNGYNGTLSLPSTLTTLGDSAFNYCTGFRTLSINNGLETIGVSAFYNCTGLTGTLTIPSSVKTIDALAFYGCSGFTGELVIPSSVETIGDDAFNKCTGFTSLSIGNNVTSLGARSFQYCEGLTGPLVIPNRITSIGDGTFEKCKNLSGTLTIPSSVTSIGKNAFKECEGLTGSLTIPSTVTSIGEGAFYRCLKFTGDLTIPDNTTYAETSFYQCCGLNGTLTLPRNMTTIPAQAFHGCGFTGDLTIPDGVTSIGNGAFQFCQSFNGNLNMPNSITSIGDSAFEMCNGFTGDLVLPSNIKTIGECAFQACKGFTGNFTIPSGTTTIGKEAFYMCYGLTGDLTIPNSVKEIGATAFYSCSGFDGTLTIPNSVTTLGNMAFRYCIKFNKINNQSAKTFSASWFINNTDYFIKDSGEVVKSTGTIGNGVYTRAFSVSDISFSVNEIRIQKENTERLIPTILPTKATNKMVTWESGNTAIATVDSEGTVTAVSKGETIVSVTTEDGNKTATCKVIVYEEGEIPAPTVEYHIYFNGNGGTAGAASKTVIYNSPIGMLPTATREGYDFLGWYDARTNGNRIYATDIYELSSDLTCYAMWNAKSLKVMFNANGGSASGESKIVSYNSTYGMLPTCASTDGHIFQGWYTDLMGGTRITESSIVSIPNDHTLYAQWNTNEERNRIEETELHNVPTGLQQLFDTLVELANQLINYISARTTEEITQNNSVLLDVVLKHSTDGGMTWQTVTAANFPVEGVEVLTPYPSGTNKNNTFHVAHIFADNVNGHVAGEIEYPWVSKTDAGLVYRVFGLSPVMITWDPVNTPTPSQIVVENNTNSSSEGNGSSNGGGNNNASLAVNYNNDYSASAVKAEQGLLCRLSFALLRPLNFKEAYSLSLLTGGRTNYDLKKGKFTMVIPLEYRKSGRIFALIGVNNLGIPKLFNDLDKDDSTITVDLDISGYAFDLIYSDDGLNTMNTAPITVIKSPSLNASSNSTSKNSVAVKEISVENMKSESEASPMIAKEVQITSIEGPTVPAADESQVAAILLSSDNIIYLLITAISFALMIYLLVGIKKYLKNNE